MFVFEITFLIPFSSERETKGIKTYIKFFAAKIAYIYNMVQIFLSRKHNTSL
jgi:hypothetical protein